MKMSSSVLNIFPAYIKARKAMGNVYKNIAVQFNKTSYKYADLPQIVETVNAATYPNDLAFIQSVGDIEGCRTYWNFVNESRDKSGECKEFTSGDVISIENMLIHASGEWMSKTAQVLVDDKMPSRIQCSGASVTYARRVSALGFWFIAVEDEIEKRSMSNNIKHADDGMKHGGYIDLRQAGKTVIDSEYNINLLKTYIAASSDPAKTEKHIIDACGPEVISLYDLSSGSIEYWCKGLKKISDTRKELK